MCVYEDTVLIDVLSKIVYFFKWRKQVVVFSSDMNLFFCISYVLLLLPTFVEVFTEGIVFKCVNVLNAIQVN